MLPDRKKVSKRGLRGIKYTAGIGYLIIPEGIDRETYIINCYRNGTISFITENAERFDEIKVSKNILNDLDFPLSSNLPGSQILFNVIPLINIPVVIGSFTKSGEVNLMFENTFNLSKKTKNSVVSIVGDANKGSLNINLDSFQDSGGELNINVNNKSNNAKIKVAVNGKIELESTDELLLTSASKLKFLLINPEDTTLTTEFSYEKEVGFKYKDEFGNELTFNKENIIINAKEKIILGAGKEPLVLGDTLKGILEDILAAIGRLTVNTYFGPSTTPINAAEFEAIKKQLNTILSKYSTTD